MNLLSNISLENNNVSVLNELHRDNASFVSHLPKDVVGLIEHNLLSEPFTKISRETPCARTFKIGFIGGKEEQSPASQQASRIAELYDSTKIDINEVSIRISTTDINGAIFTLRGEGGPFVYRFSGSPANFTGLHAHVYFLKPTIEFPCEGEPFVESLKCIESLKCRVIPIILAWKKMDLNEAQREGLKKLPSYFSIVEYGEDSDLLLLKTIEKIIEMRPGFLPEKEKAPSAALAAQSAPGQRSLLSDCTIQ